MDLLDIFRKNVANSMSQSEVFRPSNGDLLVRSNIAHGTPIKHERPSTQSSYRFGSMSHNSFFTRHNPHPVRVRHMKGLLDIPICAVNDNGFFSNPRYSLNFPPNNHDETKVKSYSAYIDRVPTNAINVNSQRHPINTITGLQSFMGRPLNMRIFREKAVPNVGMVPVTDAWRDELRTLVEAIGVSSTNLPKIEGANVMATGKSRKPFTGKPSTGESRPRTSQYSAHTGRLIPPPSRDMSRQSTGGGGRRLDLLNQLEHISEDPDVENTVLQLLCQILQTDDISAVQAWLVSAGEREKTMVLDMIRAAMGSEETSQEKADWRDPEREGSAVPPHDSVEGQIIGAQSNDLTKRIDRLSLLDGDCPQEDTYKPLSLSNDVIAEENYDDLFGKPPTNAVFRPSKSGGSRRSLSRLSQQQHRKQPRTPAYGEHKLKYTIPSLQDTAPKVHPAFADNDDLDI